MIVHLVYERDGDRYFNHAHAERLPRQILETGLGNASPLRDCDRVCVALSIQHSCRTWELDATDGDFVLGCLGACQAGRYLGLSLALVIDLSPKSANRELFRVTRVSGFSEPDWTPLLLRLERLGSVHYAGHPDEAVPDFTASAERPVIHEFLYLRRGHEKGTYNWGRIGSVNGTVLWPHHLEFFCPKIRAL